MKLEKEYVHASLFIGAAYNIGKPKTIGELKSILEQIASDLPEDKNLEVSEVYLHDGKLEYTLVDGIFQ